MDGFDRNVHNSTKRMGNWLKPTGRAGDHQSVSEDASGTSSGPAQSNMNQACTHATCEVNNNCIIEDKIISEYSPGPAQIEQNGWESSLHLMDERPLDSSQDFIESIAAHSTDSEPEEREPTKETKVPRIFISPRTLAPLHAQILNPQVTAESAAKLAANAVPELASKPAPKQAAKPAPKQATNAAPKVAAKLAPKLATNAALKLAANAALKVAAKPVPKLATNAALKLAANAAPKVAAKPVPKLATNAALKLAANAAPKVAAKPVPKLATNAALKLAANAAPKVAAKPVPKLATNVALKLATNAALKLAANAAPKVAAKPVPKLATNAALKLAANAATKVAAKPVPRLTTNAAPKVAAKPAPKLATNAAPKVASKPAPKLTANTAPKLATNAALKLAANATLAAKSAPNMAAKSTAQPDSRALKPRRPSRPLYQPPRLRCRSPATTRDQAESLPQPDCIVEKEPRVKSNDQEQENPVQDKVIPPSGGCLSVDPSRLLNTASKPPAAPRQRPSPFSVAPLDSDSDQAEDLNALTQQDQAIMSLVPSSFGAEPAAAEPSHPTVETSNSPNPISPRSPQTYVPNVYLERPYVPSMYLDNPHMSTPTPTYAQRLYAQDSDVHHLSNTSHSSWEDIDSTITEAYVLPPGELNLQHEDPRHSGMNLEGMRFASGSSMHRQIQEDYSSSPSVTSIVNKMAQQASCSASGTSTLRRTPRVLGHYPSDFYGQPPYCHIEPMPRRSTPQQIYTSTHLHNFSDHIADQEFDSRYEAPLLLIPGFLAGNLCEPSRGGLQAPAELVLSSSVMQELNNMINERKSRAWGRGRGRLPR